MNARIAIVAIMMALISFGSATMSVTTSMTSGGDSFTDSWSASGAVIGQAQYSVVNGEMLGQNLFTIGPNTASFSENTIASYLKKPTMSDDPYIQVAKSISNSGSGMATFGMVFLDTWTGVSMFSGMKTDKYIDSASMSMYATDFSTQSMTGSFSANHEALTAEAGQLFDRSTWTLTHKFDVSLV